MNEALKTIRERLSLLLEDEGLAPAELDLIANLSKEVTRTIVRKKRPSMPRAAVIAQIARATGYSADWLLGLSDVRHLSATAKTGGADDPYLPRQTKEQIIVRMKGLTRIVEQNWPDGA